MSRASTEQSFIGNYQIVQSVITGRGGAASSRPRLEALAQLNEAPEQRGCELPLLSLVFCGDATDRAYELPGVLFRPAFLQGGDNVEHMHLEDALAAKRGTPSVRFAMRLKTSTTAAIGNAIVLDLGYKAGDADASVTVVQVLDDLQFKVRNLVYEHANARDESGYLAAGFLQLILDDSARSPCGGRWIGDFTRVTLYEAHPGARRCPFF